MEVPKSINGYTYDDLGRLILMAHSNSSGMFTQFDYTLNAVGNRTGMTRSGALAAVDTYQFDATDQITQASYAGGARTESFNYDPVGNRITSSDSAVGTTNYTANALNQYTGVGAFVPTYDSRGNLTTESPGKTYSYESKNRLISATNGTNRAAFDYDCRNRQMSRTINGATVYFVYDDWNLIAEYTAAGALAQKYVHGASIDEILAKVDSSGTVYYHQDGLGSVVALTDSVGSLSESYRYDVFGAPSIFDASGTSIATSASENRFLFTGREWIAELELYDYRNRVYSMALGRFMQTDPIRFDSGDVNLYRYAINRPFSLKDPKGLNPPPSENKVPDGNPLDERGVPTDQADCLAFWDKWLSEQQKKLDAIEILGWVCAGVSGAGGSASGGAGGGLAAKASQQVSKMRSELEKRVAQEKLKCGS